MRSAGLEPFDRGLVGLGVETPVGHLLGPRREEIVESLQTVDAVMDRLGQEGVADVAHQANAKLVFHAVLSREATGSRIYLQVQHTRRPRSPLVRSEDVSSKEHRTVKR